MVHYQGLPLFVCTGEGFLTSLNKKQEKRNKNKSVTTLSLNKTEPYITALSLEVIKEPPPPQGGPFILVGLRSTKMLDP